MFSKKDAALKSAAVVVFEIRSLSTNHNPNPVKRMATHMPVIMYANHQLVPRNFAGNLSSKIPSYVGYLFVDAYAFSTSCSVLVCGGSFAAWKNRNMHRASMKNAETQTVIARGDKDNRVNASSFEFGLNSDALKSTTTLVIKKFIPDRMMPLALL